MRLGTLVRWGGPAASVVLAALWIGSAWFQVLWEGSSGIWVSVIAGYIELGWHVDGPSIAPPPGWYASVSGRPTLVWGFRGSLDQWVWWCTVPLWAIAAPFLLATGAAWWMDARARWRNRPGYCRVCGYDLCGLASGAGCPECDEPRPA